MHSNDGACILACAPLWEQPGMTAPRQPMLHQPRTAAAVRAVQHDINEGRAAALRGLTPCG